MNKRNGGIDMACIECGKERMHRGTFLCHGCYNKQREYLKTRVRDIETYNEDRKVFLLRKSKELGLNHTLTEINSMISQGYDDEQILKTKEIKVWTHGSEPTKAMPVYYSDVIL